MRASTATEELDMYISAFSAETPAVVPSSHYCEDFYDIPVREDIMDPTVQKSMTNTAKTKEKAKVGTNVVSFKTFLENCKNQELLKKHIESGEESSSDTESDYDSPNDKNEFLLAHYKESAKMSIAPTARSYSTDQYIPKVTTVPTVLNQTFKPLASVCDTNKENEESNVPAQYMNPLNESTSIINYDDTEYEAPNSQPRGNYKYTPESAKGKYCYKLSPIQTSRESLVFSQPKKEMQEINIPSTGTFMEQKSKGGRYQRVKDAITECCEKMKSPEMPKTETKAVQVVSYKVDSATQVNFENSMRNSTLFNSQIFEVAKAQILTSPGVKIPNKKAILCFGRTEEVSVKKQRFLQCTIKNGIGSADILIKKPSKETHDFGQLTETFCKPKPELTTITLSSFTLEPLIKEPLPLSIDTTSVPLIDIHKNIAKELPTRNHKLTTIKEESCEISAISLHQENTESYMRETAALKIQRVVRAFLKKKSQVQSTIRRRYKFTGAEVNKSDSQEYKQLHTLLKTLKKTTPLRPRNPNSLYLIDQK